MSQPPIFDDAFKKKLTDLFVWRRDVRRFRTTPLQEGVLDDLLKEATLAPSVGNSQPWRFVKVTSQDKRQKIRDNFERCNVQAMQDFDGEQARIYAQLKLSGMDRAPEQVAVFCDSHTQTGKGLGQKTMPETLRYSVVSAIQTLWLSARARGVGLGWVSIIDPAFVKETLDIPNDWDFVAYLCIGYPEEEHDDPELIRHGWQDRLPLSEMVLER